MIWGFFSLTHIVTLLLSAGITICLYYLLKNKSDKAKTIVLGILSFSGISAIIFNLLVWNSPIEYLPLHLCSLTALILPFCVFTRNNVLCNLSALWSLGAILAIVVNNAQANYEIFSWTFFFYYFPHTIEFALPILFFKLGLAEKRIKYIGSSVGITMAVFTVIHFINLGINKYCIDNNVLDYAGNVIKVNYMYSILPENPVLGLFYKLIPMPYWYMWLALPVMLIYLGGLYAAQITKYVKKAKV